MSASSNQRPTSRSFLLELPAELRLSIYDFALSEPDTVTITSGPVAGDDPNAPNYTPRNSIRGLPPNHFPIVRSCYDASLLNIMKPARAPSPKDSTKDSHCLLYTTSLALLQTSRFINAEVASHIRYRAPKSTTSGGLSLYLSFPHGLLVLKSQFPSLLRQARNVYICGYYNLKVPDPPNESNAPDPLPSPTSSLPSVNSSSESLDALPSIETSSSSLVNMHLERRSRPPYRSSRETRVRTPTPPIISKIHPPRPPHTNAAASSAMVSLVRTLLPPTAQQPPLFRKLELRTYYPDECAYSQVWSDEGSPVIDTLRNTCGGLIDMEVWRGRTGCGVVVKVRPQPGSRVVSTIWRRLPEGRAEGSWAVGEKWGGEEVEEAGELLVARGRR